MSRVFVAHDRALGRRVAVKVLSREVAAEVKTERFRLEIQLAARLQHPHIVPLLQSGEMHGILYFTMPFIEGESLRMRLERDGPLPMPDALRLLRQVASALAYAHRQGVIHRDIKPDNVLLHDEFALVTDFGVARALSESVTATDARITSSGVALGTPSYMSPEQALADPEIDHRADIYAFGILAYEILTGAPPFRAKSAQATLAAQVVQKPDDIAEKRADIPPHVAEMIMQCLEKKPDDRPQSAAELVPVFDTGSTASLTSRPSAAVPRGPSMRSKALRWTIGAVVVLAIGTGGYFATRKSGGAAQSGSPTFTSVAVLPLVNVGGDQADEYFSDGMTDELSNALAKLPGLKVASRTSAYAFKGKNVDVGEIGQQLHVQAVLEGTVRRSGERLRVAAQLTSVADGLALWSDTYERETRDVFSVQDDIARSIAQALRVRLGSRAQTFASESRGTENLDAFDAYLRGRYFLNRRGADNLRLAVTYFDSAVARDTQFGRARAGLATAYALLPEYTDTAPSNVSALTQDAAGAALAIDTTLAEAYTAMGLADVHDWKFSEAEAAYKKALMLDPQYPTAHQWYGELLFHTGRLDSSLAQIRTAVELDPLAPINAAAIGYVLVVMGRYDEAIAELKKGIELAPALGLHHAMLGQAYVAAGRVPLAIPQLEMSAKLDPELALRKGLLARAYGLNGQTEKAQAIISQLEARQKSRGRVGVALAAAYLGVGDKEKAITALEQAVEEHDISLTTSPSLVPDKLYDPLRSDPRFLTILRKMNLDRYAAGMQRR